MVSCTDFIPFYSEMFKFLEKRGGYETVERYWEYIRDNSTENTLGKLVDAKGIEGCWNYWNHTLNEEAADFVMTYDEDACVFEIDMRHCPSKGKLMALDYMEPYHDYCGHCAALYTPVLKRRGLESDEDYTKTDEAKCRLKFYMTKG